MRLTNAICVLSCACLSAAATCATEKGFESARSNAPPPLQQGEGESPSGKIRYILEGEEDDKQLLLYDKDLPDEKIALCKTHGWEDMVVSFSPNEEWLIVQDGTASLGVYLRLFHRKKRLKYEEIKNADIGGKAESVALKQKFEPNTQILEHRYVHVLPWSADSKMFLVELSGRGKYDDRWIGITHWIGIFNVATGDVSTDLAQMNRHAAEIPALNLK